MGKYIIIYLFLFLNSEFIIGQNNTDSLGQKQGRWMFFSEYDTLIGCEAYTFCTYVNGIMEGSLQVLDNKENIRYEVQIVNGKRTGIANLFDAKHRLVATFNFEKEELRSIIRFWKNGKIYQIIELKNGIPHGSKITFRNKGKMWNQISYQNGKLNGHYKNYYRNGHIRTDELYKDDELTKLKVYYRNGKLK